jgi:hypothetical protein
LAQVGKSHLVRLLPEGDAAFGDDEIEFVLCEDATFYLSFGPHNLPHGRVRFTDKTGLTFLASTLVTH